MDENQRKLTDFPSAEFGAELQTEFGNDAPIWAQETLQALRRTNGSLKHAALLLNLPYDQVRRRVRELIRIGEVQPSREGSGPKTFTQVIRTPGGSIQPHNSAPFAPKAVHHIKIGCSFHGPQPSFPPELEQEKPGRFHTWKLGAHARAYEFYYAGYSIITFPHGKLVVNVERQNLPQSAQEAIKTAYALAGAHINEFARRFDCRPDLRTIHLVQAPHIELAPEAAQLAKPGTNFITGAQVIQDSTPAPGTVEIIGKGALGAQEAIELIPTFPQAIKEIDAKITALAARTAELARLQEWHVEIHQGGKNKKGNEQ